MKTRYQTSQQICRKIDTERERARQLINESLIHKAEFDRILNLNPTIDEAVKCADALGIPISYSKFLKGEPVATLEMLIAELSRFSPATEVRFEVESDGERESVRSYDVTVQAGEPVIVVYAG